MDFLTVVASSITGIITFFIGQRRAKKEIEGLALNNIERSLDIYNKIIEDLKDQVTSLLDKVDELEKKIDELKDENYSLRDMLERRNKELEKKK